MGKYQSDEDKKGQGFKSHHQSSCLLGLGRVGVARAPVLKYHKEISKN